MSSTSGARAAVFATVSDMDIDLASDLSRWVLSPFRPSGIYFPPYDAGEIRGILQDRIRIELYSGVFSATILDRIVEQTMESGDVRVGLDLVKRAVLNAECAARIEVIEEDVTVAYEQAKHIHFAYSIRALSMGERLLLRKIAELSQEESGPLVSGAIYGGRDAEGRLHGLLPAAAKADSLRLVDLIGCRPAGGRAGCAALRAGEGCRSAGSGDCWGWAGSVCGAKRSSFWYRGGRRIRVLNRLTDEMAGGSVG